MQSKKCLTELNKSIIFGGKDGLVGYMLQFHPSSPAWRKLYRQYYRAIRAAVGDHRRVVMGPGQKIFTQVGSGQFFVARVGSAIHGLGLNLENFP